MVKVIYKKPVPSTNEGNLVLKDFKCEVDLLRSSEEGSDLHLRLIDPDTDEILEETLTVPGLISNIDGLKDYLLTLNYFYEE